MDRSLRQCRRELSDLVRVSKMKDPARKRLKSIGGLWMKALTTLGVIFAAPLSAAPLFATLLGVSKSKLICIVKGSLAMDK